MIFHSYVSLPEGRLCNFLLTRDNKRVFLYLGDIEMIIDSAELLSSAQNTSIKTSKNSGKKNYHEDPPGVESKYSIPSPIK